MSYNIRILLTFVDSTTTISSLQLFLLTNGLFVLTCRLTLYKQTSKTQSWDIHHCRKAQVVLVWLLCWGEATGGAFNQSTYFRHCLSSLLQSGSSVFLQYRHFKLIRFSDYCRGCRCLYEKKCWVGQKYAAHCYSTDCSNQLGSYMFSLAGRCQYCGAMQIFFYIRIAASYWWK